MHRIKELRKEAKLSQIELAERLNVHQTAISQWETGKTFPDMTTAQMLADFFDVSIDFLFGRTSDSQLYIDTNRSLEEINSYEGSVPPLSPKAYQIGRDYDSGQIVYDEDTLEMMREMCERPELRALFKTSKKATREDIETVDTLLKRLSGEHDV